MRLIKNPELKGILALVGIALVLAIVFFGLTGTLTDWFGLRLTFKKPLTSRLVFVSDRSGHPNIWTMNPDGGDQRPLTNGKFADSQPTVSPDGYAVIFVSRRDTPQTQLFAVDPDGSHPHRITDITGEKSYPRFTPDGKEITFICSGDIWRAGSRGDHPERVLPTDQQIAMSRLQGDARAPYVWAETSPDGKLVAGVQTILDTQTAMWLVDGAEMPKPIADTSTGREIPLTGEKVCLGWAPGSRKLAITLTDRKGRGIMVTDDLDDGIVNPALTGSAMGSPCWSPDGSAVAFEILRRTGAREYRSGGLGVLDIYDQKPKLLVKGEATKPIWSPDGNRVIYVLGKDIWAVEVESGKTNNLTKGRGANYDVTWAPAAK